jgi:hypothetical protein
MTRIRRSILTAEGMGPDAIVLLNRRRLMCRIYCTATIPRMWGTASAFARCTAGVDLILDIDLKLREQPSVAGEVLIL